MVLQSRAKLGVETFPEAARPVMENMRRIRPLLDRMHRETFGAVAGSGEDFPDEEQAVAGFHRHVAKVEEGLPAERLLVFDVREGWGPVCDFLGVEVPDEAFPHLNDREFVERALTALVSTGRIPDHFE